MAEGVAGDLAEQLQADQNPADCKDRVFGQAAHAGNA